MGAQQGKFQYRPGECLQKQDVPRGHFWALYKGSLAGKETAQHGVTLYVHTVPPGQNMPKVVETAVANALQKLKVLRHPHIVKYLTNQSGPGMTYMVTDPVVPLASAIGTMSPWQVLLGLHGVISAVAFLHGTCHLVHNHVGPVAVYVDPRDGAWKLGGFEFCQPAGQTTSAYLKATQQYRQDDEDEEGQSDKGRDVSGLLRLVEYVQARCRGGAGAQDVEWRLLEADLRRAQNDEEYSLDQVLQGRIFAANQVVALVGFMETIGVRSQEEKQEFFSALLSNVRQLPSDLFIHSVLPHLLTPRVLLEPAMAWGGFLPNLLTPASENEQKGDPATESEITGIIPLSTYRTGLVPHLHTLYTHHIHAVRMVLLGNLRCYLPALTRNVLQTDFLPEVVLGLEDTNSDLVFATLEALLEILHKVGDIPVGRGGKNKEPLLLSSCVTESVGQLVYFGDKHTQEATLPILFGLMKFAVQKDHDGGDLLKRSTLLLVQLLRTGDVPLRLSVVRSVLEHHRTFHVQVILGRLMPLIVPLVADPDGNVRQLARDVVGCVLEHVTAMAEDGKQTYVPAATAKKPPIPFPVRKPHFAHAYPRRPASTSVALNGVIRVASAGAVNEDGSEVTRTSSLPASLPSLNTLPLSPQPAPPAAPHPPGLSSSQPTLSRTSTISQSTSSLPPEAIMEDAAGVERLTEQKLGWDEAEEVEPAVVKVDEKVAEQKRLQRLAEMERKKQERQRRLEEKKREKEREKRARNMPPPNTKQWREMQEKLQTEAAIDDMFSHMQPVYKGAPIAAVDDNQRTEETNQSAEDNVEPASQPDALNRLTLEVADATDMDDGWGEEAVEMVETDMQAPQSPSHGLKSTPPALPKSEITPSMAMKSPKMETAAASMTEESPKVEMGPKIEVVSPKMVNGAPSSPTEEAPKNEMTSPKSKPESLNQKTSRPSSPVQSKLSNNPQSHPMSLSSPKKDLVGTSTKKIDGPSSRTNHSRPLEGATNRSPAIDSQSEIDSALDKSASLTELSLSSADPQEASWGDDGWGDGDNW